MNYNEMSDSDLQWELIHIQSILDNRKELTNTNELVGQYYEITDDCIGYVSSMLNDNTYQCYEVYKCDGVWDISVDDPKHTENEIRRHTLISKEFAKKICDNNFIDFIYKKLNFKLDNK